MFGMERMQKIITFMFLRNHMHTVENKQNYGLPKYLTVESLQKTSNLYCRSKKELREKRVNDSNLGLFQWPMYSGAHFSLQGRNAKREKT